MNDRAKMKFFCGKAGESFAEVIAGLSTEDTAGSCPGAVASFLAIFENICEEIEVSLHEMN